ncbi:MAG TPA: thioredoxin domain-containing protein [Candidatus Acidoferrum sp.]|nr:thioredoxin domain-containing protein [Candidatus Acidoferrum sp.]
MNTTLRFLVTALAVLLSLGAASALADTRATPKPEPEVSFSTPRLHFSYQLVGTSSPQMSEVVTNSGTAPLVITAMHVTGEDAADFAISSNFPLPVTVLPGQSVTVNVSFAPGEPWTPGTRRARLKFTDNDGQQFVTLTGMGVNCGGPVPAVFSNGICADTDLDGLNDVWEDNDYIDMNNNGRYDPGVDFKFPHKAPFVFSSVTKAGSGSGRMFPTVTDPGVEVRPSTVVVTVAAGGEVGAATFTYSVSANEEGSGSGDDASTGGPLEIRPVVNIGGNLRLLFYRSSPTESFVAGDTFSFTVGMGEETKVVDKNVPNIFVQYDYMDYDVPGNACVADPDCDQGGFQLNDVCHSGFCTHNHFPGDPLFRKVVDQFAAHGITLYIHPSPKAVPHAAVVTWAKSTDQGNGPHTSCAGDEVPAVGITGSQAINFHNIKNRPGSDFALDPSRKMIYHYAVLSHASICLTDINGPVGYCGACSQDRSTPSGFPRAGSSGNSELPGNDFIVSLGPSLNNALGSVPSSPFIEEGIFMHELGHNLGLHHLGDVPAPERAPNYLSIMNYKYSFTGIQHAATPGSNVPVEDLRELDYSEHTLNTLVEGSLDETAGTSPLSSGYTGIVRFFNGVGGNARGAEAGPIDWDGINGIDPNPVSVDINKLNGTTETMVGYRDWDHTTGQSGSGGGACTTSADCRVNAIRQLYWANVDRSIDTHEPCLNGRCQSLWLNFQNTAWGIADGLSTGSSRTIFEPGAPGASAAPKINVSYDKTLLRGAPDAIITIVEFTDFRCAFCRQAESTLKEVLAKYPGKVALAHKDYPLGGMDSQSALASRAARCAGEQGKFWEYRDLLLGSPKLDGEVLASSSQTLNLNVKEFDSCLAAERYKAAIEQDLNDGNTAGVSATPAFFINGVRVTGAQPASTFEKIIDQELGRLTQNSPGY